MVTVSIINIISFGISAFALGYSMGLYFTLRGIYGKSKTD